MAKLSPVFNGQVEDENGAPAVGWKIYTYAAGSSTAQATYTTQAGSVAQANPIILNADGATDTPIWLTEGQTYKFLLKDENDVTKRTIDNVSGVGDTSIDIDQWNASGLTPTYVSATSFTVPGDQTTAFHAKRRFKATTTGGTIYGAIVSAAYDGSSLTTVTVTNDSGSLDSGLSAISLGVVTATNTSLPKIADFTGSNEIAADSILARHLGDAALGFSLINGTLTASVGFNALTVAIKTKDGADPSITDPVLVVFRNATVGTGDYSVLSLTAATSLTISSGSTLGTTNATLARLWVVGFNDAGTFRLGVINLSTMVAIGDDVLASSTAEGGAGAADSAGVYYTGTAVSSKPMRVLGYVESTQTTAGTWATVPSKVHMISSLHAAVTSYPDQLSTASGSAPSYSARAWVNFNGIGTVAIRASGNVSSITDNGVGDYTVNFATAMPDADYAAVIGPHKRSGTPSQGAMIGYGTANPTTTALRFNCITHDASVNADMEFINVAIFR